MSSTQEIVRRHSTLVAFEDKAVGIDTLRRKNKLKKWTMSPWQVRERRRRVEGVDYAFSTFVSSCLTSWIFPAALNAAFDPTTAELVASGVLGVAAGPLCVAAFIFGPQTANFFAVPEEVSSARQLAWPMRARLKFAAAAANRKEGWQPRDGMPHPKGRDDIHDRFQVRVFTDQNEQLAVALERWHYQRRSLEKSTLGGSLKTARRAKYDCWHSELMVDTLKSFDQEEEAFAYYQELMMEIPERESKAVLSLAEQRAQQQQAELQQAQQKQLQQEQKDLSNQEQNMLLMQRKARAQQLVDIARVLDRKTL